MLGGEEPVIEGFDSFEEEVQFLQQRIHQLSQDCSLSSMCLVLRTNQLVGRYRNALQAYDLPTYQIRRSESDDQSTPGLRVTTMHRVKGLQFEHMFLSSVNQDVIPLREALKNVPDPTAHQNILTLERSLLHVAATRAKQSVTITYYGEACPFLSFT